MPHSFRPARVSLSLPGLLAGLLVLAWSCLPLAAAAGQPPPAPRSELRVVLDNDYPPYIFRAPDGHLQGILVDQWALWEQKTGVRVKLDPMDWAEAQRRMEAGEYDVIDTIFTNPRRQALYDFTRPYASLEVPLFFSRELPGIRGPQDLAGFVVGAKRGGAVVDYLKAHGISNIRLFDNYQALLGAVRDGRIVVFTVERPPAMYYLIKLGIQDQFRATEPLYTGAFHRAVRKGDRDLLNLVQRGFDAISPRDYQQIERRWYGAPAFSRDELALAARIAAGAAGLLGLLLLWVWALRRSVRRRTAELMLSHAQLKSISSNFKDGMFYQVVTTADGSRRFTYLSDSVEQLYGVSPEQAMADPSVIYQQIHEEDIHALMVAEREAITALRTFKHEVRIKGPAGEVRWSSLVSTPRRLDDGTVCWDGIEFIITDRKAAEQEHARLQAHLMQAQKMESLGSLAGGVAHDMNNVLGAILALASANLETQPEGSPARRAFATITQAAVRGGKMVKSLLSFARQNPAEERELDLNGVLREEVRLLERTTLSRIRLELDLDPELRPVRGDSSALSNVFMNLCVNAVDAMADNGQLTLRTRNLAGGWIEAVVQDTGCGMAAEVLQRAMDPFFTTKEVGKGTGLGLSMVYSTVQAHHGVLELQSEPGRGTRVAMRFPAAASAAPAEPAVESARPLGRRSLSVLVVDDDDLVQCSTQALLEVMGHRVLAVAGGEQALERLEAGFEADVILLDMNMPGLGGAGTLPRLRRLLPEVPVLLATGRVDQAALDLVEAHSRVFLLSKPFSMEDLERHLGPLSRSGLEPSE